MPRKDPMTGVMVMTTAELFDKMGKEEGKPGYKVMEEMYTEMDNDKQEQRKKMEDPATALKILREVVQRDNRDAKEHGYKQIAEPIKVLKVLNVDYDYSFGSSSEKILAIALTKGKRKGVIEYSSWTTNGTYWEPTDGETEINWLSKAQIEKSNIRI